MAKRGIGGMGGGMGGMDINALMKQAQQMQNDMLQAQGVGSRTKRPRPAPEAAWSR